MFVGTHQHHITNHFYSPGYHSTNFHQQTLYFIVSHQHQQHIIMEMFSCSCSSIIACELTIDRFTLKHLKIDSELTRIHQNLIQLATFKRETLPSSTIWNSMTFVMASSYHSSVPQLSLQQDVLLSRLGNTSVISQKTNSDKERIQLMPPTSNITYSSFTDEEVA